MGPATRRYRLIAVLPPRPRISPADTADVFPLAAGLDRGPLLHAGGSPGLAAEGPAPGPGEVRPGRPGRPLSPGSPGRDRRPGPGVQPDGRPDRHAPLGRASAAPGRLARAALAAGAARIRRGAGQDQPRSRVGAGTDPQGSRPAQPSGQRAAPAHPGRRRPGRPEPRGRRPGRSCSRSWSPIARWKPTPSRAGWRSAAIAPWS